MGIRIHKVAGWGLLEVPQDDARINWESPLLTHKDKGYKLADYRAWLVELRESLKDDNGRVIDHDRDPIGELAMFRACEDDAKNRLASHLLEDPAWAVSCDYEGSSTSTFVVRPVSFTDWARTDDTLDWIQDEMILDLGLNPHTDQLYANPYPFSGTWMNRYTGERFRHEYLMPWVRLSEIALPPGKRRPWEGDLLEACDLVSQEMGFTGHAEASDVLVPNVPGDVRRVVEFGELFTDWRTVLELRPMLYTFWR